MGRPRKVASFGVGLDLLVGDLTRKLDGFLNKTAQRIAGFSGRLSALVSLPIGLLGRQMDEMATLVDLRAREATALLAATYGDNLFSPESQAKLEQNYQDIIDRSLQLSIKFGEQASEVVESVFFAIGTGFPTLEDAFRVTEQATIAAAAGATETAVAMNVLLDVLNAYGLGADQARYVSDVLFQTVNIGKVEFDELATSMGDIIGIAPLMGISLEELGAVIATATKQGQAVGLTLTGLRQVLINVLAPKGKGAAQLAEIFDTTADRVGIVIQEVIELEGLFPTLQKIAQEVAIDPITGRFDPGRARQVFTRIQGFIRVLPLFVKLTEQEANAIRDMNKAIDEGADPGQAAEATMIELSDAMGRLNKETGMLTESYAHMQVATSGVGATAKAFSETAKSLDRRSKQATAAIDALKIIIGLELKAALLPVLETIGRLVKTMIDMPKATKRAIVVFLIIATVVPPAIFAISLFIGVLGNLVAVIGGLVSFALSPLVLVIGFLVGSLLKAKLAGDEFQEGMARAANPIQKVLEVVIALASVAADIFTVLAQHIANFVRFVAQAAAVVARFFGADIRVPDMAAQRKAQDDVAAEAERIRRRGQAEAAGRRERDKGRDTGREFSEGVAEGIEEGGPEVDRRFADLLTPSEEEIESTFTRISRAAIRALLRGMSDVDFDIFADAVGLVDAEIRALGLSGEEAASALQNAQIALAQAVAGDVGAWETLRSIIGDSVDLIREYVQARKAAIAAEEALKAVEMFRRQELARLDEKIAGIRERIRQFELDTAEIPERFTRHRKRQLDEELNAAQKEKEARQKQLDAQVEAARAQAEAAREHASHLSELLRMEQQLLGTVEEMVEETESLEDQIKAVFEATQAGAPKGIEEMTGAFDALGKKLNTLDLFFKGLMRQELDPAALRALTDEERLAYEQGQRLRDALDEILGAVKLIIDAFRDLGGTLGSLWKQAPDWLQKVLIGGALTIAIGWKVVGAALSGVLGGALKGVAGLALRGGSWVLSMGMSIASTALSALAGGITSALGSVGLTAATGAIWALPIILSIVAVKKAIDVKKQIEQGLDETTDNWASFLGNIVTEADSFDQMLTLIQEKRAEIDKLYEEAGPLARAVVNKEELFGDVRDLESALVQATSSYTEYVQGVARLNEQVAEIPEVEAIALMSPEEFETARADLESGTAGALGGLVAGMSGMVSETADAAEELGSAITEPIIIEVEEMADELVGQSIIPDMVDTTISEFERMGLESGIQLTFFSNWVAQWGTNLLSYWYALWDRVFQYPRQTVDAMVAYIQAAMEQISQAIEQMSVQATGAVEGMSEDIVFSSIIPDMVDAMVAEFDRMREGAGLSFVGLFGDATAEAIAGAQGIAGTMAALQGLGSLQVGVPVFDAVEREPTGAEFNITNYWDASITDKDRSELEEVSRNSTFEAIVLAYGGVPSEQ